MKKIILSAMLAASIMTSQTASAYALVQLAGRGYVPEFTRSAAVNGLLCVLLLPFCILEEEGQMTSVGEKSLLAAHGLNDAEIASVMNVKAAMVKANVGVDPDKTGTLKDLEAGLMSIGVDKNDAAVYTGVLNN